MLLEVSEYGTVRTSAWTDDWWNEVQKAERRLDHAICGSSSGKQMCLRLPETRIGKCRWHYQIIETSSDVFRDPVYSMGVKGVRICGAGCQFKDTCEYYSQYYDKRPEAAKPYCYRDIGIYLNQVKELNREVKDNLEKVTQFIKIAIQTIAIGMVQVSRCDEELASGNIIVEETEVFVGKAGTNTKTSVKENPAISARMKMLKTIADTSKAIMLPPKTKKELKNKGLDDSNLAKSPMELAGQLLEKVKVIQGKTS